MGESKLFVECAIFREPIKAGAEHYGISRGEFVDLIAERLTFDGSSRCVGFWILPEQDTVAPKFIQRSADALVIGQRESWCEITYLQ